VRRLGELEAAIMDRLWSWGRPATVREVLEDLQQSRVIAYTTVMTVMDNLHKKGVLARDLEGRAYRYRATKTRDEYAADLLEDALSVSADRTAALLGFVGRLSPKELARLRRALDGSLGKRSKR
jgi:predicted transcriptional regulator